MCGGGGGLPPATDPKQERLEVEADAARSANAQAAQATRARRKQSLLAQGAQGSTGTPATSTVLAYGKPKLGS